MRITVVQMVLGAALLSGFAHAGEPATRPAKLASLELIEAIAPCQVFFFDPAGQAQLKRLSRQLREMEAPSQEDADRSQPSLSQRRETAEKELFAMLERSGKLLDVTLRLVRAVAKQTEPILLPGDAGAFVLRISSGPGEMHVINASYDLLTRRDSISLDVARSGTTCAVVQLAGAPGGVSSLTVEFKRPGGKPASLMIPVLAPNPAHIRFKAVSADTGEPLPTMIELVWNTDGAVRRPSNAVDLSSQFEFRGVVPGPRPAKLPGRLADHHWWCVPGPFDMPISPGGWRLIVRHGLEYLPIFDEFTATSGQAIEKTYRLRRWVDMPKLGWWSGDDHVHSQMTSDRDAERLMAWTQAEDTHVANILKMSDVYRTWFEQRGFGPAWRVRDCDYVLVPGQECPRTHSDGFGHTISLNAKSYVRNVREYWLYDRVADTVREQGGLFGFAHTYLLHPYIRRGMSLIATQPRVDMAEIMQMAQMGTDFYYDWLNLGYQLAATAGSDVPFQGTIGEVRMYAYLGDQPFSADAWFDAVKRGRTFATNGPMLDLQVDDAMPGDRIAMKEPRSLHVRARAWGDPELMVPARLEIIRHGEVIRSIDSKDATRKELLLEFDVPAGDGCWLAARSAGTDGSLAHTTPVYIVREPLRFWKYDAVPKLIDARLANLAEIERMIADARNLISQGRSDGNMTAQTMAEQADPLLQRVAEAKKFYEGLRQTAERERPLREKRN